MDYIEVIENEPQEMDFSSFYADYDYESSEENENTDYDTMTLKQLLRIRDYYNHAINANIPKLKKHTKKNEIINDIIEFESNISNIDVVIKRNKLWKYIDELKADKYMKQFIFWS